MFAMLRTGSYGQLSKNELLKKLEENDADLNVQLNVMQSKIIGSAAYWNLRRGDLMSMDNTFGPATFFLTVSIAEFHWKVHVSKSIFFV